MPKYHSKDSSCYSVFKIYILINHLSKNKLAKEVKDNSDAIANAIGQIEKGIEALKNEVLEMRDFPDKEAVKALKDVKSYKTVKKNTESLSVEIDADEEQDDRETREDTVPPRADPVKENKPNHDKKKKVSKSILFRRGGNRPIFIFKKKIRLMSFIDIF